MLDCCGEREDKEDWGIVPNDPLKIHYTANVGFCMFLVGNVSGPGTTGAFQRSKLGSWRPPGRCGALMAGNKPTSTVLRTSKAFP